MSAEQQVLSALSNKIQPSPAWALRGREHGMQAQAASLRRITQGGLNEASASWAEGLESSFGEAGASDRNVVSTVDIVRHPSEAEQVLRMLPAQLRGLKKLPRDAGQPCMLVPRACF